MSLTELQVEKLQKRVAETPGSPGFARLADHHRSLGRLDEAISLCLKGIDKNPHYPTGHLLLGRCLYEKNQTDEARAAFEAVLKLDHRNVFALKMMGDILVQFKKPEEAAVFYRRACDCDPLNHELTSLLSRYRQYLRDEKETEVVHLVSSADPVKAAPPVAPEPPAPTTAETEMIDAASDTVDAAQDSLDEAVAESDFPMIPEVMEISQPAPARSSPAPPPPVAAAPTTEMVDLPPAMSGYSEEKMGAFEVRKSLYERLKEEEGDLLEEAFDRRTPAAEQVLDEVPAEAPVPEAPSVSSSAAGVDGFYSVDGGEAESGEAGAELILEGINDIELEEAIPENSVEEESISEQAPHTEAVEEPALDLLEAEAPAPVQKINLLTSKEAPPVAAKKVEMVSDVDVDDDLKSFLTEVVDSGALGGEAAVAAAAPVPAQAPPAGDFSAAAAGADGFYSVTGDAAAVDLESPDMLLAGLDDVEIVDAAEEEVEVLQVPDSPAAVIEESPPPTGDSKPQIELGNDIDLKIPAVTAAAPSKPAAPAAPAAPRMVLNETTGIKVVGHVATASLAELYFKQGHKREALAVYRKLLTLHPGDPKIEERLRTLEKELKGG